MAFDGTLKFNTAIDQTGFKSGIKSIGDIAGKGLSAIGSIGAGAVKAMAGAVAAGSTAVAAIGKQALDAYADFEQLAGGVETLFGDAAQIVMDNAAKAFETAGMSANAYMETATSSAAAMVNSLGGDTKKAAELTDMAIRDMSDNINKMGSAVESVQNAYAGFAKGNFTMLDNLKLGYGGTKQEMERLLAKAQELTGVQYDISSYADIVQAIHAIQENMGVTGTTAQEAATTISGSTAMMKASWDNLLVGIADDQQDFDRLADEFVQSVETAAGNILPRVEVIGDGLVKLIGTLGDDAVQLLVDALTRAPELAGVGVQLIGTLLGGLTDNLPALLRAGKDILLVLANGIINSTPDILDASNIITDELANALADPQIMQRMERMGRTVLSAIGEGLTRDLPVLLELGLRLIGMLGTAIMDNLPLLLDAAVQIIGYLVEMLANPDNLNGLLDAALGILLMLANILTENLSPLLTAAITIVQTLGTYLGEHADTLVETALTLLLTIVNAIFDNTDLLLMAAETIIGTLWETLLNEETLAKMVDLGFQILTAIMNGLLNFGGSILGFALDMFLKMVEVLMSMDWIQLGTDIVNAILDAFLSIDFGYLNEFKDTVINTISQYFNESLPELLGIGTNILAGIADGLINGDFSFIEDIKTKILGGFGKVFEQHSPSRVMRDQVGKYLAQGVGVGFVDEMPNVAEDARRALGTIGADGIGVSVDTDAVRALREMQGMLTPSSFVPAGSGSSVVNNYSYTTNNSTNSATPDGGGVRDIIIPVSIGGDVIDTVVVHAVQSANAASGGVTL